VNSAWVGLYNKKSKICLSCTLAVRGRNILKWSHKRHDLKKIIIINTKCVFWFSLQLLSEIFLILRRTERDMIQKKCISVFIDSTAVILVRFQWNLNFLDGFRKILKYKSLLSHRACCHTCYTIQLMHYSRFKTQSLQHLKPIKC
jgi:hypothetical protein